MLYRQFYFFQRKLRGGKSLVFLSYREREGGVNKVCGFFGFFFLWGQEWFFRGWLFLEILKLDQIMELVFFFLFLGFSFFRDFIVVFLGLMLFKVLYKNQNRNFFFVGIRNLGIGGKVCFVGVEMELCRYVILYVIQVWVIFFVKWGWLEFLYYGDWQCLFFSVYRFCFLQSVFNCCYKRGYVYKVVFMILFSFFVSELCYCFVLNC